LKISLVFITYANIVLYSFIIFKANLNVKNYSLSNLS